MRLSCVQRAAEGVPRREEACAEEPEQVDQVRPCDRWIELTERELLKALEKHGVRKFEPLGEKFDPNLHQAMLEIPDPSVPAGTVVQIMQPGYTIGERVLRPALVGVSKGGPKASAAEAPANDNTSGS